LSPIHQTNDSFNRLDQYWNRYFTSSAGTIENFSNEH
jgi:hypothetical protein